MPVTESTFNAKPMLIAIIALLIAGAGTAILLLNPGTTGYAIQDTAEVQAAKVQLLQEEITKINALNISVQEKQLRIQDLTLTIDELYAQREQERKQSLEGSIELINAILTR